MAANTILERDLWQSGVSGVTWHASRVPPAVGEVVFGSAEQRTLEALDTGTQEAIRALAPLQPRLIVLGLSGSPFGKGVEGHDVWKHELETIAGVPVVTLADAILAEASRRRLNRVGLLTPFPPPGNAAVTEYLGESGIEVAAVSGLDARGTDQIACIPQETLRDAVYALFNEELDGILQIGTNLDFVQVAREAEAQTGTPVIAANAALARQAADRTSRPI
jgi:maleate isomerase